MHRIVTKILLAVCSFCATGNALIAGSYEEYKKAQMIQDLEVIKHHYEIGYAPAKWKKEYSGWDLEESFEKAKHLILETPSITTKQFQLIVHEFVCTMKDYHVDVMFYSTEAATLPFTVKGAEGRYFIDWIDPLRLAPSYYPIRVGDELVQFNERPTAEVIAELLKENGKSASEYTDQTLAQMNLTKRSGMMGHIVPRGPIVIQTRSASTGKINTSQLHWSYTPEHVKNPLDFLPALDFISGWMPNSESKTKIQLPQIKMSNPLHENYAKIYADRDGGLGSRKSYIPMLGEPLWIKDEKPESDDPSGFDLNWYAYIYRHPNGKTIGYIRIPHYIGFPIHAKQFGEIINYMEENTDALVIDQVHNFGGLVVFQYALATMLAIDPLKTPHHRVKITQKDVIEAHRALEFINLIELILQSESSKDSSTEEKNDNEKESDGKDGDDKDSDGREDDGKEKEVGSDEGKKDVGKEKEEVEDHQEEKAEDKLEFNYQEILFLKSYFELIIEEWDSGHTLTRPTPILGVDRLNPHPKYQYTKPILMLIDEMDFSGGDFMPAILQDNKRAKLFGTRTAGAGGFVYSFEFPNSHGIAICSYTASIAERPNLQKIENLGVTPDIEYHITPEDLQDGYQNYINAVNQSVEELLNH